MKLSNSKRQLAEIIRVHGDWDWDEWFEVAAQDSDGEVMLYSNSELTKWSSKCKKWVTGGDNYHRIVERGIVTPIAQHQRTKLTRDEYMSYLSEFETPVPNDTVTESPTPTTTIETLIKQWSEMRDIAQNAREQLTAAEQVERDAHARVEAALAAAGWGGTVKSSRSGEIVEWEDWKVGDTVIFDGYTNDKHRHWAYAVGKEYTIEACDGYTGPLDDNAMMPYENYGFRFIRP